MNAVEDVALAAVPGGSGLKLAIKAAPFLILAVLVGIILVQHLRIGAANAQRDLAVTQSKALGDVIVADSATIKQLGERQVDNDAIAAAVAKRLDNNRAQTEGQRQAIRNASNDPTVRNWANTAVPDSVRRVLETDGDRASAATGRRSQR